MVGKVEFKISGAKEMADMLKKLPADVATKLRTPALRAGAKIIAEEAKSLVPVDTGKLRASIEVRTIRNVEYVKGKGLRTAGESRVAVAITKPASSRAHLVEFGTAHNAAKPFLRPALDSKAGDAIAEIGKNLGRGIRREAEKLAGITKTRKRA